MAGTDPQKQLLTLIRDFASEKSQGERKLVGLKKRIEELHLELDAANIELEEAKSFKETTEQELKGCELELTMNDTSIQTIETRISMIQDDISVVGSEVEGLKNEEGAMRDEFLGRMFELNRKIREFRERIAQEFSKEKKIGTAADSEDMELEADITSLDDMLALVLSQKIKEEQECLAEENIQKQVQQEYVDIERKVSLVDVIMKETNALKELTRYPYDHYIIYYPCTALDLTKLLHDMTSELEQICASLGEELQRRCVCPSCCMDNVEALGGILQANEVN